MNLINMASFLSVGLSPLLLCPNLSGPAVTTCTITDSQVTMQMTSDVISLVSIVQAGVGREVSDGGKQPMLPGVGE